MTLREIDIKGELDHLYEWLFQVDSAIRSSQEIKKGIESKISKLQKEAGILESLKIGEIYTSLDLDDIDYDSLDCIRYFDENGINIDLEISKDSTSEVLTKYIVQKIEIEGEIFNVILKRL